MKKWLTEDYEFEITVLSVGPENKPEGRCRRGFEMAMFSDLFLTA